MQALSDDAVVMQEYDAVGDLAGELHLGRHDQHGLAAPRHAAHQVRHFAHPFGTGRGGRLVELYVVRVHHHDTPDADPLTLAARQGKGVGRPHCPSDFA
ncbi:hypothetical protein [Loktanella fryxellensis]|uniref:hypothetical protein n=1 Tax=Loktanella fryxellensis TaxID=245187 RepID=UPI0015A71C48